MTPPDKHRHEDGRKRVNLNGEVFDELLAEAQSMKISMKILAETFIGIGLRHGLHKAKYIDRLNVALDQADTNRFEFLNNCYAVTTARDSNGKFSYRCVQYRDGKSPQITKLGDTEEMASVACAACQRGKSRVRALDVKDERINELETKLQNVETKKFKIPKCNGGADVAHNKEDSLIFRNCKKHPSGPVSIEKFCRVYQGGLPCMLFAEVIVGLGKDY